MQVHRWISAFFCSQILLGSVLIASVPVCVQYVEGYVPDKTYAVDVENFTILHLNTISRSVLEQVLSVNADIVCLSKALEEDDGSALYHGLKNAYAHFYRIASALSPADGLFIASKYSIEDLQCTSFPIEEVREPAIFFDFVIKKGPISLGHYYVADLKFLAYSEQILEKMKSDFSNLQIENVPFFFREGLALCGGIKTIPIFKDETESSAFITTIERSLYKELGEQRLGNVLCRGKDDDDRGYVEYDFSVREGTDGSTRARGGLDYTRESEDSSFSVGAGAEVERDRTGETKGAVDVHVKGKF